MLGFLAAQSEARKFCLLKYGIRELKVSLSKKLIISCSIIITTARSFWNSDFFLTNVKFTWPTKIKIYQISPGNGLNPPLTATLSIHLFMLSASHMQYTWIDRSLTERAKRIAIVLCGASFASDTKNNSATVSVISDSILGQEVNFDWFSKKTQALEQSYTLQGYMHLISTLDYRNMTPTYHKH